MSAPAPPTGAGQPPRARPGPWRRLLRGLLLSLGVLLLGALALEITLRVHGEYHAPLFVHEGGRVRLAPGHATFVPVDVAESPDRLRIVSMGASTIVGVPYEPVLSPPRWLGLVLERRGVRAEVISVAAPGLDSRQLLKLLPDVLELHPDALVIATGHNEYLAASQLLHRPWWNALRIGPLIERRISGMPQPDETLPTPEHGFDHAEVARNFRANIHAMQALADGAGVPLLLCAEVCNLADFPPVLGDAPPLDEDADAAYQLGRTLLERGDSTEALAAFVRARDRDRWPHRTNTALNDIVRDEAHCFVPLDRLFVAQSRDGAPGFDLFVDHCHPNPAGQRLMALGVADALEDLKLFPLTGRRGTAPPLEAGLRLFGADDAMEARAQAQVGRSLTGFALMRGAPGPLSVTARHALELAGTASGNRAGEVMGSLMLLDLLDGNRQSALVHLEACRAASRPALLNLQRLHDDYPWVQAVFTRNGVTLKQGYLQKLPP